MSQPTSFEKPRGVSRVEVRHGFAQAHVSLITNDLMSERLQVLNAVSNARISIDFLKLTQSGLQFLVPAEKSSQVESALRPLDLDFTVRSDRSIVLVHGVNLRDEEGLIASIVRDTIATGARVDHIGDMHDRVLMVVDSNEAERVAEIFQKSLVREASPVGSAAERGAE